MKKLVLLAAVTVATLGTGCGTVEKMDKLGSGFDSADCQVASSEALGYEHGKAEKSADMARLLSSYCDSGSAFDAVSYEAGYERGLNELCTYDFGLQRAGTYKAYGGACNKVDAYVQGTQSGPNAGTNPIDTLFGTSPTLSAMIKDLNVKGDDLTARATEIAGLSKSSTSYADAVAAYEVKFVEWQNDYKAIDQYVRANNLTKSYHMEVRKPKGYPGFVPS